MAPRSRKEGPSQEAINFAMRELAKKGGFNSDANGRALVTQAQDRLGADLRLPQAGDKSFVPAAYGRQGYDDMARNAVKSGMFADQAAFDQAIAKAHGAEAITDEIRQAALSDAQAHGQVLSAAYQGTGKGAVAALETAGKMLTGDAPAPDMLFQVMGITEDKVRAKYGNAAADGFQAEVSTLLGAGKVKEAIEKIGITDEQLKSVIPSNAVFDVPLLKDMPPWGQAAALAGAGAAAGGLAYHLMAQGQQQQSSADYAAAMQALNAY